MTIRGQYRPKQSREHNDGVHRVKDGAGTTVAYLSCDKDTTEIWCLLSGYGYPTTMEFELISGQFLDQSAFETWLTAEGVVLSSVTLQKHAITEL